MTMLGKQYGSTGKTMGIYPGSGMPATKKHKGSAVKILGLL